MQIKFNGVMTQHEMLEQLASVLARFEATGLDRVMNVVIELQPPPPSDPEKGAEPHSDALLLRHLKFEFGEPGQGPHDREWIHASRELPQAALPPDDTRTFAELLASHWQQVDIGSHSGASVNSGDGSSLVPRLLRTLLGAFPDWDGSLNDENIAMFDAPRKEFNGRSFWDATRDDDGFLKMFTVTLIDPAADAATRKRRGTLRDFLRLWREPGPSLVLREMLLAELAQIVGSRLQAAAFIALRPMRYGRPQLPAGTRRRPNSAKRPMTLMEAVFEADNAVEVVQAELDGYRGDLGAAASRPRPH